MITSEAKDDPNQPHDEDIPPKPRVTGAARRRFHWWVRQGKSPEEAKELALKPFSEIPEYNKIKNQKDAKKAKKRRKVAKLKYDPKVYDILTGIKVKTPITELQVLLLKKYILKCIIMCDYEGEGPHFSGCYSRCGIFIMKCSDERTLNWLSEIFPEFEPWEGANVTMLNEREVKSEISMFFRRKQSKKTAKAANALNDNKLSDNDELKD